MKILFDRGTDRCSRSTHSLLDGLAFSLAKEATLNIKSFFDYQQRQRRTYSHQLAQLISHARHLNDYFTLATNGECRIGTPNVGDASSRSGKSLEGAMIDDRSSLVIGREYRQVHS